MKVKRLKKAGRILNHYHHDFGFSPPYSILADGTFCQAALKNKINLREQLPKYLDGIVELVTTRCILEELEKLGSQLYGALVICRQFHLVQCPHTQARSAAECILRLARKGQSKERGENGEMKHPKYMVASQDGDLLEKLRNYGGIPLMSIHRNTILLAKPSTRSLEKAQEEKTTNMGSELSRVKELKRTVLGTSEETSTRKRKRRKGVNPLACKKRKRLDAGPPGHVSGAFGKRQSAALGEEDSCATQGVSRNAKRRKKWREAQNSAVGDDS